RLGARQRRLHVPKPILSNAPEGSADPPRRRAGRALLPACQGSRSEPRPSGDPAADRAARDCACTASRIAGPAGLAGGRRGGRRGNTAPPPHGGWRVPPPTVAGVLRARNCRVPQPSADGAPRNVIRGEFFAKGEAGWAVLCSVNNSTALLAFRNDRDTNPDTVTTSEDRNYLQGLDD